MKWKWHDSAGDLKCQGAYVTLLPLNDEHITWLQINTSSLAVSSGYYMITELEGQMNSSWQTGSWVI